MSALRIHIKQDPLFEKEAAYVLQLLAEQGGLQWLPVQTAAEADIVVSDEPGARWPLNRSVYEMWKAGRFSQDLFFSREPLIQCADGRPDYISTIFYMVNALQEMDASAPADEIGRFQYSHSYQHRFAAVTQNLVRRYCLELLSDVQAHVQGPAALNRPSVFFLSHDIDSVYGALRQDGLFALKKGRPDILLRLFVNVMLARPDWMNIDQIVRMESEYDMHSAFYWIVNKGKLDARRTNADYAITDAAIQRSFAAVTAAGSENGLHKSLLPESFAKELARLPAKVRSNRCHYLAFRLPDLFTAVEASGLEMDASLGFAEAYGFRNSYGLPYHPFNLQSGKPFGFLEVPLTVMDGTLQRYMKVPVSETASRVIRFFEENNTGCLHSVLWHNTFFTRYKYKGYLDEYKAILTYLYESKYETLVPSAIISTYRWKTR